MHSVVKQGRKRIALSFLLCFVDFLVIAVIVPWREGRRRRCLRGFELDELVSFLLALPWGIRHVRVIFTLQFVNVSLIILTY